MQDAGACEVAVQDIDILACTFSGRNAVWYFKRTVVLHSVLLDGILTRADAFGSLRFFVLGAVKYVFIFFKRCKRVFLPKAIRDRAYVICVFACIHAESEASAVRQDHEKDLQIVKQRLLQETQLREKEAAEFADRLQEVRSHICRRVCIDPEPELREL